MDIKENKVQKIINECLFCDYCIDCGRTQVKRLYCDKCRCEQDKLYSIDDVELCDNCLIEYVKEHYLDAIFSDFGNEIMKLLDIEEIKIL